MHLPCESENVGVGKLVNVESAYFLERQRAGWELVSQVNDAQRATVNEQQALLLQGTERLSVRHAPSWTFYSKEKPAEEPYTHVGYYHVFSLEGKDMDVARLCYGYFRKKLFCTLEVLQNADNREAGDFPKGNERNALVLDHCIRSSREMLKAGWNFALVDHSRPRYKAVRDRYFHEKSKYYFMHYFPHTDSSMNRRAHREWKDPNRFCLLNNERKRVQQLLNVSGT